MKKDTSITIKKLLGKPTKLYEIFHHKTKRSVNDISLDPHEWPEEWKKIYYKGYARFPEIKLPKPYLLKNNSLKNALNNRTSKREFTKDPLSTKTLSSLLYYGSGINQSRGNRFYPSAGARYPIETYVLSLNSELTKGLYHYYVKNHSLEELVRLSTLDVKSYFSQEWVGNASNIIIFSAMFERNTMKYGDRGYRMLLQEAGHMIQNMNLVCASLHIAACSTDGFYDDELNKLLDIDGLKESVIAVLVVGSDIA